MAVARHQQRVARSYHRHDRDADAERRPVGREQRLLGSYRVGEQLLRGCLDLERAVAGVDAVARRKVRPRGPWPTPLLNSGAGPLPPLCAGIEKVSTSSSQKARIASAIGDAD
jgi:hypothetical protein